MPLLQMSELALTGKRLLIRADLNVPINSGQITSDARIRAVLPTIQLAIQQGAKVMVASHLGRPIEGSYTDEFSLAPVANYLKQQLDCPVRLVKEYLHGLEVAAGEVVMLENVRFNSGESGNNRLLAAQYAALCDIFVMEAFGAAHRAQASTHGVAQFAPIACAGPLLINELTNISKALRHPRRPLVAIVSGSKISSKLPLLQRLSEIADQVIVGGGIANTFIAAQGNSVGKSLYEMAFIPQAQRLMDAATISVATDVRVAKSFSEQASAALKSVTAVQHDEYILDIGSETAQKFADILSSAKTILWNGPLGVFEWQNFRHGTAVIAQAIADSSAFSIAGGGDTIAAIELFGITNRISYISTGGGAFLEFVEGKKLPVIAILEARASGQVPEVI